MKKRERKELIKLGRKIAGLAAVGSVDGIEKGIRKIAAQADALVPKQDSQDVGSIGALQALRNSMSDALQALGKFTGGTLDPLPVAPLIPQVPKAAGLSSEKPRTFIEKMDAEDEEEELAPSKPGKVSLSAEQAAIAKKLGLAGEALGKVLANMASGTREVQLMQSPVKA